MSSILRRTASRTNAGKASNAAENVGDQIWRAAATTLTRLSCRELPRRDFASRLIQLGFYFIRQFKIVLETFIDPITNLLKFSARQLRNRCFDFFDRAHLKRLIDSLGFGKIGGCWALSALVNRGDVLLIRG